MKGREIDTSFVTQDGETLSEPVRFRRGWMLGRRHRLRQGQAGRGDHPSTTASAAGSAPLWLSQSDKLLEDARRDWTGARRAGERRHPTRQLPAGHGDPA